MLFLDLEKAFDRVDRGRLIHILMQKAKTMQEKHIVSLLAEVLKPNKIHLGEHAITDVRHGVPQGGVLSPALFNVYLHEALTNHPVLEDLIKGNRLLAYADDLAIIINYEDEVQNILEALDTLRPWGLKVNKQKSELLAETKDDER